MKDDNIFLWVKAVIAAACAALDASGFSISMA